MNLQSNSSVYAVQRDGQAIRVAMASVGDDRVDDAGLRDSLEQRGALVHDWPVTLDGAPGPWTPETDVLLITARLLDARVSRLIKKVAARPTPFLIVLSDSGDVVDRIIALELGADDFLSKDSDPREILARARSLIRRKSQSADRRMEAAGPEQGAQTWVLNDVTRVLHSPAGSTCELSRGDVQLINALTDEHGDVCITAPTSPATANSLRVSISRLRRRFQKVSSEPLPIRNVWGRGYRFDGSLRRISSRASLV